MPDTPYPPRIQAFRDDIIRQLPRVPNTRDSLAEMHAMPTRSLVLHFVTWKLRLIPAKPRPVRVWAGGIHPVEFMAAKEKLRHFLQAVEAGRDLTPYLSDRVNSKGVVLRSAPPRARGQDIDMVLTREGLHHFHIGQRTPANPKGRSGTLLFAEVMPTEFKIVAMADHKALVAGTPEQMHFHHLCRSYMAKDIPSGQGFMANPVFTSGHSVLVFGFALKCEDQMQRLDSSLDDGKFVDRFYDAHPADNLGRPFVRPEHPVLAWHFEDLQFGLIEKQTRVFFCIFPFFAR